MNRYISPSTSTSSSTGSTVVPATSSTTTRCCPASLVQQAGLADVRLADDRDPARPASTVRRLRGASGSAVQDRVQQVAAPPAVQGRHRVRLAQPQVPQSPQPRPRLRWSSTLFAASTTGLPAAAQYLDHGLVDVLGADRASTTNRTASAAAIASSACSVTWAAMPLASGAQPPVSTSTNSARSSRRRRRPDPGSRRGRPGRRLRGGR